MSDPLGCYLRLSIKEQQYLRDIVGMWIEGHAPALEDMVQDRTIENEDQLLELSTGMHDQLESAQRIYERLST